MTVTPNLSSPEAEVLAQWLRDRCGFHFVDGKLDMMSQRLRRVAQAFNLQDLKTLASELQRGVDRPLIEAVVSAASTNHTFFFREEAALNFFRDAILRERAGEPIRVWSAAASTGDEAYTCAMISSESLGRQEAARRVALLGTDISIEVVRQAEAGEYSKSHIEQIGADLLQKYFVACGEGKWRIAPDIRKMCMFRRLNLMGAPYPFKQRFHFVFCRNVLYYFDLPTQRTVVESIYDATEPGGYLLVSAADSLRHMQTRWVPIHASVYRRPA